MSDLLENVAQQLHKHKMSLTTAESCTGGWLAKQMTDLAGSSAIFERGFVTYSNASKREMLGVAAQTLEQHGAVSEAVVAEMVAGALKHSAADVAIAISGIAGPGGGTEEKPVGTVCFAWQISNQPVITKTKQFRGDREAVRLSAVNYALEGLDKILKA